LTLTRNIPLFSGEIPKSQPHLATLTEEERVIHFTNVQRRNADFTTGIGVLYEDEPLTIKNDRLPIFGLQPLGGVKLRAGERLLPSFVTRCSNLQPVRLIHEVQFDSPGAFRIYVLAGPLTSWKSKLKQLSDYLLKPTSFVQRFQIPFPRDSKRVLPAAMNTGISGYEELNPRFNILTIIRNSRFRFDLEELREYPGVNSMIYTDDQEAGGDRIGDEDGNGTVGGVHRKYGLEHGGIVVCRPDGYVGIVVPLEERGWKALEQYFDAFLISNKTASLHNISESFVSC